MKKILKIIIILITILIVILICLPLILAGLRIISLSFLVCLEMSEEETQNIIEEAKSKKDVEICNKIGEMGGTLNLRWNCISQIAATTKDESLCERIPVHGTDWREDCYMDVAKAKEDPLLCEKAGSWEEYCYQDIAIAINNLDLCMKAVMPNSCIKSIAINNLNIKLCDQIGDYEDKMDCINEIKLRPKEKPEAGKLPDLIISEVKIEPPVPKLREICYISAKVKNIGKGPVYNFWVRVYRQDTGFMTEGYVEEKLFPGEETLIKFGSCKCYPFIVKADSENWWEEIDEANNEKKVDLPDQD